jgi:hypothetical protein
MRPSTRTRPGKLAIDLHGYGNPDATTWIAHTEDPGTIVARYEKSNAESAAHVAGWNVG